MMSKARSAASGLENTSVELRKTAGRAEPTERLGSKPRVRTSVSGRNATGCWESDTDSTSASSVMDRFGLSEAARRALSGAREVLLQGSFYEVSLALVGVASLAVLPILGYGFAERKSFLYEKSKFFLYPAITLQVYSLTQRPSFANNCFRINRINRLQYPG